MYDAPGSNCTGWFSRYISAAKPASTLFYISAAKPVGTLLYMSAAKPASTLLAAQRIHRIGQRGFDALETDRQQRDEDGG